MKTGCFTLLFLGMIIVVIACKNESQILPIKTTKNPNDTFSLKSLHWILGNWENVTADADMREIWHANNDSLFEGESYVTVAKDTVFHEWIDVIRRNDSVFYIVSVKNENNEKPVAFYATKLTTHEVVFENPKHDFPSKIVYKKINSDSLVAEISGVQKGKPARQLFPMKKSKT